MIAHREGRPPQIILDRNNEPQSLVCPPSRLVNLSFRLVLTETAEPGRIASFYGCDRKCLGLLALIDRRTLAFRRAEKDGVPASIEVEIPGDGRGVDVTCTLGPERDVLRANGKTAASRVRRRSPRVSSVVFPSIRIQDGSARGIAIESVSLTRSEGPMEPTHLHEAQRSGDEAEEGLDTVGCETRCRDSMKGAFARSGERQADLLFVGLFRDPGGYGKMNRSIVRGLMNLGIKVKPIEIVHKKKSVLNTTAASWDVDFEVAVAGNALQHPQNWDTRCGAKESYPPLIISGFFLGVEYGPLYSFYPGKVILLSMYEAQPLPQYLVDICNRVDEVWVPGESNRKVFTDSGVRRPIELVPLGVDKALLAPEPPPRISTPFFELPDCRPATVLPSFLFLFMGTVLYHKGVDSLLRAFLEEFGAGEDVGLWCHSRLAYNFLPRLYKEVTERIGKEQFPRVFVTNATLPDVLLPALFRQAACYVSLSRGEGWDLPLMEAGACGLPIVATDCLGHRDYLTGENALLVPLDGLQVALPEACGEAPLHSVHHGALLPVQGDAFIARARAALREAFEKRATGRAARLRETIQDSYTWDKTVERVLDLSINTDERPRALSGLDAFVEEFEAARLSGDQAYLLLSGSPRQILDQAARLPCQLLRRLESEGIGVKMLVRTDAAEKLRCLRGLLGHFAWLPTMILVNPFEAEERGISASAFARELMEEMAFSKIRVLDILRRRGFSDRVMAKVVDSNLLSERSSNDSQSERDTGGHPVVFTVVDAGLDDLWPQESLAAYCAVLSCLNIEGSGVEHALARFDVTRGCFHIGHDFDDDGPPEELSLTELIGRARSAGAVVALNAMVEPLLLLTGLPILSVCVDTIEGGSVWDLQMRELRAFLGNEQGIGPSRKDIFPHAFIREASEASADGVLLALVALLRRNYTVGLNSRMLAQRDEQIRKLFMRSIGNLVPAHL